MATTYASLPGEEVGGGKGQMIYTGNNGIGNYRAQVVTDYECVGETIKNPSTTTSMKFLNREPEGSEYPARRNKYVGEVGWKVDDGFMNQVNDKVLQSGNQIQLKVFRKDLEDYATTRAVHATRTSEYSSKGVSGYPPGMSLRESQGLPPLPPKASTAPPSPGTDTPSTAGSEYYY